MDTEEVKTINRIPTKHYAEMIFPNITDGYTHTPEYYQPVYDVPINEGTVSFLPSSFTKDVLLNSKSIESHIYRGREGHGGRYHVDGEPGVWLASARPRHRRAPQRRTRRLLHPRRPKRLRALPFALYVPNPSLRTPSLTFPFSFFAQTTTRSRRNARSRRPRRRSSRTRTASSSLRSARRAARASSPRSSRRCSTSTGASTRARRSSTGACTTSCSPRSSMRIMCTPRSCWMG